MTSDKTQIDPTARVDAQAVIGSGVTIGPYCVIGPHVSIGDGCTLQAHVNVTGQTSIGPQTTISPFVVLGGAPQSLSYCGELTRLVIGAHCIIRESVTMNCGTVEGGGVTEVGDHGYFMANSHVAHDCRVGQHAIFANCATLGGHCVVGDHVFIGGLTAAHQHTWIGSHAMISGLTGLRGDVIPFARAVGAVARLNGINAVGMQRRGFSRENIRAARNAYRLLFSGQEKLADRVAAADEAYGSDPCAAMIIEFVRAPRKRPLCMPGLHRQED